MNKQYNWLTDNNLLTPISGISDYYRCVCFLCVFPGIIAMTFLGRLL